MIVLCLVLALAACFLEASGYPYYPYYGSNMDTLSYGSDSNQGALVYSRFYQPYYNPRAINAGLATVMYQPPEQQNAGYYTPDRSRQTITENNQKANPQQNEVIPLEDRTTTRTETDITEKDLPTTTLRPVTPEIVEPEIDELEVKPKKRVSKKKQVTDEEDEEELVPQMPQGMMFPMFFGWGGNGRSAGAGGAPGVTAVANAYSTGRGGVATSHATAYGPPRSDVKY